jgi:hypothetical protein
MLKLGSLMFHTKVVRKNNLTDLLQDLLFLDLYLQQSDRLTKVTIIAPFILNWAFIFPAYQLLELFFLIPEEHD